MSSDDGTTVSELIGSVSDMVAERGWKRFHNPKDLSMSISIEAAELMELFQWGTLCHIDEELDDPARLEAVSSELADVLIYSLSLADRLGIDVTDTVRAKLDEISERYPAGEWYDRVPRK